MSIIKILTNHTCFDNAYVVHHYPYGRQKTEKYYWIESSATYGDRLVTVTVNPKSGHFNKPHPGTYSTFAFLFMDENEHVQHSEIHFDRSRAENRARFNAFLEQFDPATLSSIQLDNIRRQMAERLLVDATFDLMAMTEPARGHFKKWAMATAKRIKECPFADIALYPDYVPLPDTAAGDTSQQAA